MRGISKRTFLIKSPDCNHLPNLVFGGALMAEIDLCCADAVSKALWASETANQGVTHKFEVEFCAPSYLGDRLEITATAEVSGPKSITVEFHVFRVKKALGVYFDDNTLIATGSAVFVSVANNVEDLTTDRPQKLPYELHGLTLEK